MPQPNRKRPRFELDLSPGVEPPSRSIGQPAPAFTAAAVEDEAITEISLKSYAGKYLVIVFYPHDFTFVCPTEIIAFSEAIDKFRAINCEGGVLRFDIYNDSACVKAWGRIFKGRGHICMT